MIAAVEEERFNRVKKTTKFPVNAIRAWLDASGCSAADIDAVGYSWAESFIDQSIGNLYFEFQQAPAAHAPGFRSPDYVRLRGQYRPRLQL